MNMNVETQIKNYITKNLLFTSNFSFPDTASFLEEGIVDSQGAMELVLFVEDAFGITVDDLDIIPDNFDSVSKLAEYVRRRQILPA